jgi:selenocysteine lyase/cysteine desulfurase
MRAIAGRTPALGARLRERLAEVDGLRVLDRGPKLCAIVTFTLAGWDAAALEAELRRRGINSSVSERAHALYDFTDKSVDAAVRMSPHYYNTEEEVDDVVTAVRELAAYATATT